MCELLPRIETRVELLLIRHINEQFRMSNTGRLAALSLPRSRLLSYGDPGDSFDLGSLRGENTWLLFPDGPIAREPPAGVQRLVVLDASWSQARRMVQRLEPLRRMPRLHLPAPSGPRLRMRQQLLPEGMSTLESVAAALALLEGPQAAAPLERLHDAVVKRVLFLRGLRPTP